MITSNIRKLLLSNILVTSSIWALVGKIFVATSLLAINAILARLLGPKELGLYFILFNIVTLFTIVAQLGLSQAIVRLIPQSIALGDLGRARGIVRAVMVSGIFTVTLVAIGLYAGLSELFAVNVFKSRDITDLTGLTALWVGFVTFQSLITESFRGFKEIKLASLFGGMTSNAILLILLLLFISFDITLEIRGAVFCTLIAIFLNVAVSGKMLQNRQKKLGKVDNIDLKGIYSLAIPLFITQILILVVTQADIWIVGILNSDAEVGIYGAASRLAASIMIITSILYAVLPPTIAESYIRNDHRNMEKILRQGASLASVVAIPLFLVLVLMPDFIINIIYGEKYLDGGQVLSFLSVGLLVNVITGMRGYTLIMTGYEKLQLAITMVGALLNVAFCVLGAMFYGMIGVAVGAMAAMIVQCITELLAVRIKLGVWTHISFHSIAELRKVLTD